MALNDILQAIADEANGRISTAKSEHDAAMRDLKSAHTKTLTERVGRIRQITETRKQTLRSHAENQATMIARHAIVERKQKHLSAVYDAVVTALTSLPQGDVESLLQLCLKQIGMKGTIHPTQAHEAILKKLAGSAFTMGSVIPGKGGFRFSGATQDRDYTFEFLVHHVLRPATEMDTARTIFPSQR